jgi:hypothetical protein
MEMPLLLFCQEHGYTCILGGSVVLFHMDTYFIAFIHHDQMQFYKELGSSAIVNVNHMSDDHKLVTEQDEVPLKPALLNG